MAIPSSLYRETILNISHLDVATRLSQYNTTEETVVIYEAMAAPKRKANEKWFVCPVSGQWLPESSGALFRGKRYASEVVADLQRDATNRKSAPDAPVH